MYDGGEAARPAPRTGPATSSLTDWTTVKSGSGSSTAARTGWNPSLSAAATLKDHLESQLSIAALMPEDRMIAAGA